MRGLPLAGAHAGTIRATTTVSPLAVSRLELYTVASVAEGGDLEGAQAAFDAAHDPLHAVIDVLEAADSDLATELDEAVDDAETDLEEGEEAEHIVEIGNEILDLLQGAAAEIGP